METEPKDIFLLADKLSEEHLLQIGQIAFNFSKIEFFMIEIITKGFDISTKAGRIIFSTMFASEKIKTIRKLTCSDEWINDEQLRKEIDDKAFGRKSRKS